MDPRIIAHAIARGGYITRTEILDSGYRDNDIRDAIRTRLLVRIRNGAYVPSDLYERMSPEQRHKVLGFAVADKLGKNVVITHHSGCAVHDYWLHGYDLNNVSITRLDGGHGRKEAGIQHHVGKIDEAEIQVIEGRLIAIPNRCVWEAASTGSIESALVVISSALHRKDTSAEALAEAGSQFAHWQGSRSGRLAMRLADRRFESPGEARSMFMFWKNSIPQPEPQRIVYDAHGRELARVDFLWELYRHVGEFDGWVKYGVLLRPGEDATHAVVREKRREDSVRGQLLGVSRWMNPDLNPPRDRHTCDRILREMEQSRRLYTGNRVHIA